MISVSLPPVFFGGNLTLGELCEASAMTYWARYNTLPISARVLTSMQRSWGIVDATNFPRTATAPGMVIARVGTGTAYRLVVAIEGSQTVRQIFTTLDALSAVTVTGCQGHVAKYAKDTYTECASMVPALSALGSALSNPRVPVTFTGHSLGAAVAEVWACALKAAVPTKTVRFVKFGSPRFATEHWILNKNPAIRYETVYTEGDMMHGIPQNNAVSPDVIANPLALINFCNYASEFACRNLSWRVGLTRGLPERSFFAAHPTWAVLMNGFANPVNESSYWWYHTAENYRNYVSNLANGLGAELRYRYLNMEFENENQWQVLWRPRTVFDAGWNNVVLPGPDPVTPPNYDVTVIAATPPPAVVPQGQIDPAQQGEEASDATGGGSWDIEPVVVTQTYPQRRSRTRQ